MGTFGNRPWLRYNDRLVKANERSALLNGVSSVRIPCCEVVLNKINLTVNRLLFNPLKNQRKKWKSILTWHTLPNFSFRFNLTYNNSKIKRHITNDSARIGRKKIKWNILDPHKSKMTRKTMKVAVLMVHTEDKKKFTNKDKKLSKLQIDIPSRYEICFVRIARTTKKFVRDRKDNDTSSILFVFNLNIRQRRRREN